MADHGAVAGFARERDRLQRLGERADLVDLDQDRIGDARLDPTTQALGVGDEHVVAHELQARAQALGERTPALPVLLVDAVLERDDRIAPAQLRPVVAQLLGGQAAPLVRQRIAPVAVQLAGGSVEGDTHVLGGPVTGRLDRGEQHLQRFLVGAQIGREAALVSHGGAEPALPQRAAQRVKDLRANAQTVGERARTVRHHHELLEVHGVVRMGAAVEHVHHRHGHHVRRLAAEIAPQRHPLLGRLRVGRRERHSEDRVGT